jgi:phytoene dehydrogenase-like protein
VRLVADVVVVGAGIAGMAAAARLAKQGHAVVVLEQRSAPGGVLRRVERDGFTWDAGPSSVTLPAVLRDLFRKSGRPLERYVELRMRDVARRHVFADSSYVDLPTGSRGAQIAAVEELGTGLGRAWAEFVDSQAAVWQLLRDEILDPPDGGARLGDRIVARKLRSATSLARLLDRSFSDKRLWLMAAHPYVAAGSQPREVPAYGAVEVYVERTFGVWDVEGGLARLTDALVTRLAERKVELRLDCAATTIETRAGAARGVWTSQGELIEASAVVAAIDPRPVLEGMLDASLGREARRAFSDAVPASPPDVTYLGLAGPASALPPEIVFHGDPFLLVTTTGTAPDGSLAWTIQRRGGTGADVLEALARRGLDVRDRAVVRIDRTSSDLIEASGGSPYGPAWSGPRSRARRARQFQPVPGLYLIGASAHPGASLSYAAWGAAHAAALVGRRG